MILYDKVNNKYQGLKDDALFYLHLVFENKNCLKKIKYQMIIEFMATLSGMDRRSLFEAEAEAEAEAKKPSAFGRRQKQKAFKI